MLGYIWQTLPNVRRKPPRSATDGALGRLQSNFYLHATSKAVPFLEEGVVLLTSNNSPWELLQMLYTLLLIYFCKQISYMVFINLKNKQTQWKLEKNSSLMFHSRI